MIRLVTYRNLPLLDLQMEDAYRRRRIAGEFLFLEQIDEIPVVSARGKRAVRFAGSRHWLRRLQRAMDALAQDADPIYGGRRKPGGLVTANSSATPGRSKRRKRGRNF